MSVESPTQHENGTRWPQEGTSLARLETGQQDPTSSMLQTLPNALGVTAGRLLE